MPRNGVEKTEFTESMQAERAPSFSSAASGYLEKKGSSPPYRWQRRFFVATDKYLRYYQTEECEALLAAIDLRGASVRQEARRALELQLGSGEKMKLRATDEAARDEWVAALEILRRTLEQEAVEAVVSPMAEEDQVSTVPELDPQLGTRRQLVTKVKDRTSVDSFRDSMIATPRQSFPACAAGFLQKKASTNVLAGWQTRFFVACGHYLRYYSNDNEGAELLGAIDLVGVAVRGAGVDDPSDLTSREFSLELADGEIRLRAATPGE